MPVVVETPALLLRKHLLRPTAWLDFRKSTEEERSKLTSAERINIHSSRIENVVVQAVDNNNSRACWDAALFAIDCLVQALEENVTQGNIDSNFNESSRSKTNSKNLLPKKFQASIAACISRTEGVRDGFTVRQAYNQIVHGVVTKIIATSLTVAQTQNPQALVAKYQLWWEAFKVFTECTRRFLNYHDRDAIVEEQEVRNAILKLNFNIGVQTSEKERNFSSEKAIEKDMKTSALIDVVNGVSDLSINETHFDTTPVASNAIKIPNSDATEKAKNKHTLNSTSEIQASLIGKVQVEKAKDTVIMGPGSSQETEDWKHLKTSPDEMTADNAVFSVDKIILSALNESSLVASHRSRKKHNQRERSVQGLVSEASYNTTFQSSMAHDNTPRNMARTNRLVPKILDKDFNYDVWLNEFMKLFGKKYDNQMHPSSYPINWKQCNSDSNATAIIGENDKQMGRHAHIQIGSLTAIALRQWDTHIFQPFVLKNQSFRTCIWDIAKQHRHEQSESNFDSVAQIRDFVDSAWACGLVHHPDFYRAEYFVDQSLVNRRGRFRLTSLIPLIPMYIKEKLSAIKTYTGQVVLNTRDQANMKIISSKIGHNSVPYYDILQLQFFIDSANYFIKIRETWFEDKSMTLSKYIKLVMHCNAAEKRRVELYLHSESTWPTLERLLIYLLLASPQLNGGKLMALGGEANSFLRLLEEKRASDLILILKELNKTTDRKINMIIAKKGKDISLLGNTPLIPIFKDFVHRLCVQVFHKYFPSKLASKMKSTNELMSSWKAISASVSKSSCVSSSMLESDLIALVYDIVRVFLRVEALVQIFNTHATDNSFKVAAAAVFEQVMNSKFFNAPKGLATCLNAVLTDALPIHRTMSPSVEIASFTDAVTPAQVCEATVLLFASLYDKDVFQDHYTILLRERLLSQHSDLYNFAQNADLENSILNQLLRLQGIGFVSRMQRMIDDVESDTSRALQSHFRQWCVSQMNVTNSMATTNNIEDCQVLSNRLTDQPMMSNSVRVLTLAKSVWPTCTINGDFENITSARVTPLLQTFAESYMQFYKKQFPSRQLVFHWAQTRLILQAKFPKDTNKTGGDKKKKRSHGTISFELHVNALQATLLNAFTSKRKVGLLLEDFALQFGFAVSPLSACDKAFIHAILQTMTFNTGASQKVASQNLVPAGCSADKPLIKCSPLTNNSSSGVSSTENAKGAKLSLTDTVVDIESVNSRKNERSAPFKYSLNKKFRCKSSKVVFSVPNFCALREHTIGGNEKGDISEGRQQLRAATVGAAIVRIMKSRGAQGHADLFAEVCSDIKTFRVEKRLFNRQVSQLVSAEYIRRDDLDSSRYLYIA